MDEVETHESDVSMDDTIRATLAQINERETPAEVVQEAEPAKPARERDESGKFAKSQATAEQSPSTDNPEPPSPDSAVAPTRKPPSSWKKEITEKHWGKLDPELQAYMEEREGQFHKGLEQYKSSAQFAQQMERAISPYLATINSLGVTPDAAVGELLKADHALRYGVPQQKVAMLQKIARDYGIDLAQATTEQPQMDPNIGHLQQQIGQLQSYLSQQTQVQAQREAQTLNSEISSFASDPAHQHFEAVREDMAALLQAGRAQTLKDAYEMAVRANPVTFAAWQAEQQAKARDEAAKSAAKAKSVASVNVSSKPAPAPAAVIGTMDDTIRSNYRRLIGAA